MTKVEGVPDGIALLSVHEVTPAFEDDVVRTCDLLDELGFDSYTLLVTPFYGLKRINTFEKNPTFAEYLLAIDKELALHGYSHLSKSGSIDEFRRLPADKISNRLKSSVSMFINAFHRMPRGVIPPGWVAPQKLVPLSRDLGLQYCVIKNRIIPFNVPRPFETVEQIVSQGSDKLVLGSSLVELEVGGSVQIAVHPLDYRHNSMFEILTDLRDRLDYKFMGYWEYLKSIARTTS
ncbi:MAG: DUF2334 domain-containing protein [Candidatus Thorarchaeota archaeon]|nr:DUF2334 domain-containing protein [Candidatus Thorarchaeota archaeon]